MAKRSTRKAQLERQLRAAFAKVPFPGDWCLVGSLEGDEPLLVAAAFKGKKSWKGLAPAFLDAAPEGLSSALSFFSDEAFRFYLPAYLLADLSGALEAVSPVFHLTHGLTDATRAKRVNARRYGDRTWFQEAQHKFSVFSRPQAAAIAAYLAHEADADALERKGIGQALASYWTERAGG